jgi:hypothetical protein
VQTAVALGTAAQTVPPLSAQAPQLAGSNAVFVQCPPQFFWTAWQVTVHTPLSHASPEAQA